MNADDLKLNKFDVNQMLRDLEESGEDFAQANKVIGNWIAMILDRNKHNQNDVKMRDHFRRGEETLMDLVHQKMARLESAMDNSLLERKEHLSDIFGYVFLWMNLIETHHFKTDSVVIKRGEPLGLKEVVDKLLEEEPPYPKNYGKVEEPDIDEFYENLKPTRIFYPIGEEINYL